MTLLYLLLCLLLCFLLSLSFCYRLAAKTTSSNVFRHLSPTLSSLSPTCVILQRLSVAGRLPW